MTQTAVVDADDLDLSEFDAQQGGQSTERKIDMALSVLDEEQRRKLRAACLRRSPSGGLHYTTAAISRTLNGWLKPSGLKINPTTVQVWRGELLRQAETEG